VGQVYNLSGSHGQVINLSHKSVAGAGLAVRGPEGEEAWDWERAWRMTVKPYRPH